MSVGCAANSPENQPWTDAGPPRQGCAALLLWAEFATATGSYHIVPSRTVAEYTATSHREWLRNPGRAGRQHVDNPVRNFSDADDRYLERWDLLGL